MIAPARPADGTLSLVLERLTRLREGGLWPGGARDLWTDALGVVLLVSLYHQLGEGSLLAEAEWVAHEVDRVLGRRRGIRLAEGPEGGGQTFRSQALWVFALHRLGDFRPRFRLRALSLVREIHASFVRPPAGIIARMDEDLAGPFPGAGPGRLEVFLGLAVYRQLGKTALGPEIEEMEGMVRRTFRSLAPDHGVDLGLLLWITHFFPREPWALLVRERALSALDGRWVSPPGYFRRDLPDPWSGPARPNRLAISNLTVAIGLQAQGLWTQRVHQLHRYFLTEYPWEEDGADPLAEVLTCSSLNPGRLLAV